MAYFNYEIIQGMNFKIRVYSGNSILIIKNQTSILSFNTVTQDENNDLWLNVLIDQDNYVEGGIYQYQLFENNFLKEQGVLKVVASLLVNEAQDLRSRYQIIVDSIVAMLAGTATRAQRVVKVGDKEIQYMSAKQLMALQEYFRGKLKEEQSGYDTANNQMNQKYVFRIR